MELLKFSFLRVDHVKESVETIDTSAINDELNQYVESLLNEVKDRTSRRRFTFGRETLESLRALNDLFGDGFQTAVDVLGQRLLDAEIQAAARIAHLDAQIQTGILFVGVVNDDDVTRVIIAKADYDEFLDDTNGFQRSKGIPIRKRIYKAFLAVKTRNQKVDYPFVYDTNAVISKYWYSDFLELEAHYTDESNTEKAFLSIDGAVFKKLKHKYPYDSDVLRNSTVRYFRSNEAFSMDDYLEEVWNNYSPDNEEFPLEEMVGKIKDLPEKKKFDSQFGIVAAKVNWKLTKTTIQLRNDIDLVIKQDLDGFHSIIQPKEVGGQKGVWIASDKGYSRFSKG